LIPTFSPQGDGNATGFSKDSDTASTG